MGSRLDKGSESARKRIEAHSFKDEEGEEYEGSKFGGFSDYFRRKKIKLQNLDADVRSSSTNPKIFRGVVAHVNGYTQPSLNVLHSLIVSHGGGFMQYLDGKTTVTHIIAANLTPKKAIEFRRYRIVKPAWVVDSVAAGKLLPWDTYRVIDEGPGQKLLGFDEGKIVSQANTQQRSYREQTSTSWYASQLKNVAEDIDKDGAQSPGAQAFVSDGSSAYTGVKPALGSKPTGKGRPKGTLQGEEPPTSPGTFEVTSSLEDALNKAVVEDTLAKTSSNEERSTSHALPKELQPNQTVTTPQKPEYFNATRSKSPESATPSKQTFLTPRKHALEAEPPSPPKGVKLTAEEHNAILLADPHIRKSSTGNPDFIKQYYAESRLHHLSVWKAELKSRFQAMAAEKSASQRQPVKRKPGSRRYILHVDFDCFFCAVSLKSAPEYVDKPAAVAHGSGAGSEIASCNYPARALGVKNGMWMKSALKLCPNLKVLPYDFPAYEEASNNFYNAILDVGGIVQSVSIDEALVDVTALCLPAGGSDGFGVREGSIWREQEKACELAEDLRARIKQNTGCVVSVGIGENILLAKVALRKAKPAGQHLIKPEDVLDFVGELCVRDLPGVAHSIGGKLEEIGVKFVKDIRQLTKDRLMTFLGPKTGEKLWDYSRGIDKTEVGEQVVRKSVSAEVNWGIRFISQAEAEEFVQNLCIELQRRLLNERVKGRQLTMKIMRKAADAPLDPPKHLGHGKCDTFNKSVMLGVATNNADIIGREAISVLRSYGFPAGELRGLGIQMTKLESLKAMNDAMPDGSQRRINFAPKPKPAKQVTEDPIFDPERPKKDQTTSGHEELTFGELEGSIDESATPQKPRTFASHFLGSDDPIDDIDSPKKAKVTPVHPAAMIARANAADQSAKKFLNLTGTQFIIPTQVDPEVLAALPHDIRSKLMAQSKSRPHSRPHSPTPKSRSQSPFMDPVPILPSQLDPEVFEALPEDMKAEVLASYPSNPTAPRAHSRLPQSILPQSPRKIRTIAAPTKKTTPTKPRRGRPPGALNKKNRPDPHSSLTQANIVAARGDPFSKPNAKDSENDSDSDSSDTLDLNFLSALPDDVRQEILDEQRHKRLAKRGGLMTAVPTNKCLQSPEASQVEQRKLRLPPREPRPTFTTQELSTLPELRDTLSTWFDEFEDEGPHPDDVVAMERYLRRVVLDERDLGKVVSVVKWVEWLVDEADDGNKGTKIWARALEGIKEKVQSAVRERGLAVLEF